MAGTLGARPGGIFGLCGLIEDHAEAVEYDLIRLGLRLRDVGTAAFTWRDLWAIVSSSPRDSALKRSVRGHDWGQIEYLLASVVDALAGANWQRGGGRGPRPKPYPRPGQEPSVQHVGKDPIRIADFDAWWDSGVAAPERPLNTWEGDS